MTTPPSDLALIAGAVLWGAMAGALLPRAVYRFSVPWEERDGGWRASCPGGHPIRGWLGRAGCDRCAEAGAPSPAPGTPSYAPGTPSYAPGTHSYGPGTHSYGPGAPRYAVLTALVCAALAAATGPRPELAVWLLLAPVGVLLTAVDLRVRRLPDPLTLPLAAAALVLLGAAALLPEHAGDWTTALLGASALGGGYLVLHLVNPGGMAYGDVKLALPAGAVLGWYGWATLMLGTFAAFLLGALYGGALVVVGRAGRKTTIAFGPFMLAGTFAGLLIGAYAA
ncbi:prepilin peptidase [Streptomyces sp. NPDC060000]|uniref:prepilin peptidase n=1 Tax=Streptomyces sp. NPDC060000 TaxID=3347031 RepID=UPI0036CDB6B1